VRNKVQLEQNPISGNTLRTGFLFSCSKIFG